MYRAEVLTIEQAALRLEPDAAVRLDGRVDFRGDGALGINAEVTRFPLGPILTLVGMTAPVQGQLSGPIVLGGRPGALTGQAHAVL